MNVLHFIENSINLQRVINLIFSLNISVCDKPRDINNGHIDISTDGQKATYTCAVGFTLNGTIERVCGSNGSGWSDIDPSCGKHR